MNDRPTPERLAEIRRIHEANWAQSTFGLVTSMERVMCNDLLNEIDALVAERNERPTAVVQFDGPLTEAGYDEFAQRWREIMETSKREPLRILPPVHADYSRFAVYGAYGHETELHCRYCPASAILNGTLADYMTWADGHQCEVRA